MALKFIEGFDLYTDSSQLSPGKWDNASGTASFTTGRLGINKCIALGNTMFIEKTVTNIGTGYWGFGFKLGTSPAAGNILIGYEGGVANFYVSISVGRYLEVKDAAGTIQATSATPLSVGIWYYIEGKAIIGNTGSVEVKVDTSQVINATSIDIQNSSNAYITSYRFYGNSGTFYFDDHYFLDSTGTTNNTYLGDCRVDPFLPTADTADKDWTPSTGVVNYQMVDDPTAPDGDSTYVYSALVGDIDLYDFADMPIGTGDVYGLQVVANARKMDAGTKNIKLKVKYDATTQDSSSISLSTTYANKTAIFETSDGVNTAWTKATVDAAKIGIEVA